MIQVLQERNLSEFESPNFYARYIYGNKEAKGIKNCHLNIRSLKNKIQEVKNIISIQNPHIFGISEAELFKQNVNEKSLKIPGYNIIFPKSWSNEGYARVVVYVKKSFKYEHIQQLEHESIQSIWIKGNLKNSKSIYFCHAYREHADSILQMSNLQILLHQWEDAIEFGNPNEKNEVHISLDMNLDSYMGKWLQNDYSLLSLSKKVQNYCDIGNFTQLVTDPTRSMYNSVTNTTEVSCIDHVYTNQKYKCSKPAVIPFGASDHDLVSYTRYSKEYPTNGGTIKKRSYKKFEREKFLTDLQSIDWTPVLACVDLNLAVSMFTSLFNGALDIHVPWVCFQKRKHYAPWITNEMKELMKERDQWKKNVKDLKIQSNNQNSNELQEAVRHFKFYRNKINNMKKYDENNYKSQKFQENKDSAQKTWKLAKEFMNWKSSGSPNEIIDKNVKLTSAAKISEVMNKFFCQKVKDIKKSINSIPWSPDSCKNIMRGKKCSLDLKFPTKYEINKLLKNLSGSRSTAVDGLDNFSVRISADIITDPLHHIITLAIMQEKVPDGWKHAKIIPLHKKDDKLQPKNYRPVAILSPLSKILEKVMYGQIYDYVSRNGILHKNLHGYRRNRSSLTALLQLYNYGVEAANKGQISGAVLLDLSAAFDLVPHDLLLKKLEIYGFKESYTEILKSYLSERSQAVWIDHCMSEYLPVDVGVPQGSILGPLMFLIYINDLSSILDCDASQYADDTTLSSSDYTITSVSANLSRSL